MTERTSVSRPLPRRGLRRRSLVAAVLCAATASLAFAGPAAADPMFETEPNDSVLSMNGPMPADGFRAKMNVSDDTDFVILRLQGRRQVTLTVTGISGCSDNAGNQVLQFQGHTFDVRDNTSDSVNWTTPRDATEYSLALFDGKQTPGCEVLARVTPSDAVIAGPLPAPTFSRSLLMAAPGIAGRGATIPIGTSGSAADDDRVTAALVEGGCPVAPSVDEDDLDGPSTGPLLATGPFATALSVVAPNARTVRTLCVWLYDTLGKLPPLLRQQPIAIDPAPAPPPPVVTPPAPPTCKIGSRTVRQRKTVRRHGKRRTTTVRRTRLSTSCANVAPSARLEIRWYRVSSRSKHSTRLPSRWVTLRSGTAALSTKGRRSGTYRVSVWQGSAKLASRQLRVRS